MSKSNNLKGTGTVNGFQVHQNHKIFLVNLTQLV